MLLTPGNPNKLCLRGEPVIICPSAILLALQSDRWRWEMSLRRLNAMCSWPCTRSAALLYLQAWSYPGCASSNQIHTFLVGQGAAPRLSCHRTPYLRNLGTTHSAAVPTKISSTTWTWNACREECTSFPPLLQLTEQRWEHLLESVHSDVNLT